MTKDLDGRDWPASKIKFFKDHNVRPVKPRRIPRRRVEKKIAFFLKHDIKYWLETTTERWTVYAAGTWGAWMNKESSFKSDQLQFIKKVKQHIIENETYKKVKNIFQDAESVKKIKYFYYNKKDLPGTIYKDCIEIDLKGAYWEMLHQLPGVITEELYQEGKDESKVEKKTRLAAVGTCAKSTDIVAFDGKKEYFEDPIKSEKTEFLWHTICYKIGKTMARAMRLAEKYRNEEGKSVFVFFWVDAIFIHGNIECAKAIQKLFRDAGFESTVHKCEWVRFDERKIIVHSKEKGKYLSKRAKEEITLPNGKKAVRIRTTKVWTEERPFPYKKALSEADITKLSADNYHERKV